ncbi:MAG TPA: Asp-tRNA(Asn)/Glu-tRNA(Gln) amidotransferase subunit GatC [Azoarcus taiwanensis]|uniref:Aspartyl/glutamyl-tRNA(Asn/Gln) amidotransferase subunit C n=1 Tax=Azoarcus taiwanensis TaxID=666964 RepID=A0A972FAN5_9RHOO|nr:Asp-tRNA(Asn)/Glu-tRNA(Gln) amidotransferase subunit GatC [Azoarcus taiwanensis]NMG01773.1 Asp-tRNA(Asn)/Glu-tRNA(Gln) amidotransferase subunit GatC [Azoarcus taiwanensis]HRQ56377.1 Asp-tRNA(Asn)/Glu-tRNA(Gln) amidotransferase subunit GatC [Azoarcus taiwanensis]
MSLSLEDVRKISSLARLDLSESDAEATRSKLNGILELVEQMQAIDTSGVEPMSHPQDVAQRLRDDAVTETDRRDDFQRVAPQTEAGLYLVPKVIE